MNRISCEICGSSDLIKQDGVFVCQNCGCKYSPDEIKKQMVEVTNPVQVVGVETADTLYNTAMDWLKLNNEVNTIAVLQSMVNKYPGDKRGWQKLARLVPNNEYYAANSIRLGDDTLRSDLAEIEAKKKQIAENEARENESVAQAACAEIRNGQGEKWVSTGWSFLWGDIRYKDYQCVKELLIEGRENARYFIDWCNNTKKVLGKHYVGSTNPVHHCLDALNAIWGGMTVMGGIHSSYYGIEKTTQLIIGNLIFASYDDYEGDGMYSKISITCITGMLLTKSSLQQTLQKAFKEIEHKSKNNLCPYCGNRLTIGFINARGNCPICKKRTLW